MTRTLLAALALTAACTPAPSDWSGVLPDERLLIDLPAGTHLRSAAGDPSEYHQLTEQVTTDVNALIGGVLDGIGAVTTFQPTWADETATIALWGPWSDNGVDGRLWVEQHEDDSYTWALEGRPTGADDSAWIAIVAGEVDPGATETVGSGRFAMDFEAVAALDPSEVLTGGFFVDYDVQDDVVVATAGFEGFSEDAGPLADAGYHYEQTIGVDGLMDLAILVDATGNEVPELHIVRSRWTSTGEGRADAYLTDGDFGELVYQATECWGVDQTVVFYEDNATFARSGDEAACAYAEPAFDEDDAPGA